MTEPERTIDHAPRDDESRGSDANAEDTAAFDQGTTPFNSDPRAEPAGDWPKQAGRYVIGEEIARGGMGAILRAVDPEFERPIAIKVMLHQQSADDIKRFQDETRIAAQLQHPGIAPLYDLGELEDGRPFFAMKLIEGQTLDELMRGRQDPRDNLPRYLSIFEQLCHTLAYAHSQSVIHRDLKPANIMIGAFGEVQVMDWGLAKLLSKPDTSDGSDVSDPSDATSGSPETATPATLDAQRDQAAEATVALTFGLDTPAARFSAGDDGTTRPGEMMGTPVYMPPEQARGEIQNVDERSDIFGLGGILCAILTDKAPFHATSIQEVIRRAMQGDLGATFLLLDDCGADEEIIQLAKSCLAPQQQDRPETAAAIADAIRTHQQRVQERMREAEVRRAEAEVRANEEAKRRKVTLVAAIALFLFLTVLVVGGSWYQRIERQRAEARERRVQEINEAVRDITDRQQTLRSQVADESAIQDLMASPTEWQSQIDVADLILQKAVNSLKQEPTTDLKLHKQLDVLAVDMKSDQRDFDLAQNLEQVRLAQSTWRGSAFNDRASHRYATVINTSLDVNIVNDDPDLLAQRIAALPIRHRIIEALDNWIDAANRNEDLELRRHLSKVLNVVDDDPLRRRLRTPESWLPGAMSKIRDELSEDHEALGALSPQTFSLIGLRLPIDNGERAAWFQVARNKYPQDFWINFELGSTLLADSPADAAGAYRTAIAIREDNSAAWTNLGTALSHQGRFRSAVAVWERALEFDDQNATALANLGLAQHQLQMEGETSIRKALAIDGELVLGWLNLSIILVSRGSIKEAIKALEKAVEIDPSDANAWSNLGALRFELNDTYGGMFAHLMAVDLDPQLADAWLRLGNARRRQEDLEGAKEAYEKAVELDATLVDAWYNLGVYQASIGEFEGAVAALRNAVKLKPDYAAAWSTLGNSLRQQEKFGPAMEALNRALEVKPSHGVARVNLAMAHLNQGEFQMAVDLMGEALKDLHRNDPRRSQVYEWRYLSRRLVHFNKDLPRILAGDEAKPGRLVELADLCYRYKKRYLNAVALYERAFAGQPELIGSTVTHEMHGRRAAAAALLAADPNTVDGSLSTDDERTRLRQLALDWIATNMEACATLATSTPAEKKRIHADLAKWQTDKDFRSTVDPALRGELPSKERAAWTAFWEKHSELVKSLEEEARDGKHGSQ